MRQVGGSSALTHTPAMMKWRTSFIQAGPGTSRRATRWITRTAALLEQIQQNRYNLLPKAAKQNYNGLNG